MLFNQIFNTSGKSGQVSSSVALTNITLQTSATTGTYPFQGGVYLKQGTAFGDLSCNLSNYQVKVKSTFPDGSIRHAIVSGRAALTQNTPLTVTVSTGSSPSGTALTSSDISTAAPTASVQCGSFGTVSLSSLLASPFATWISGPEEVYCIYRGDVGGGTLLVVWFHVKLFADGRIYIMCVVENGFLDNGSGSLASNADRSYVPTVTINGSTVYNNGGSSLSHKANCRWFQDGWIGGDPAVVFTHDATYLRNTAKAVPPYGFNNATSTAFTEYIISGGPNQNFLTSYTPMSAGDVDVTMGATGYGPHIGILPLWNALYGATGDSRGLVLTIRNALASNGRPICWRDKTTNKVPKISSFGLWTVNGPSGGGANGWPTSTETWELAHHPGEGYLAYLATGDYWHYETLQMQAMMCYLINSHTAGSGVNRSMMTTQTRSAAWAYRTIGMLCAIAPDEDKSAGGIVADWRTLLADQYDDLKVILEGSNTKVWTGSPYQYSYGAWTTTGSIAPWMTDFWVAVNGFLSDLVPLDNMTNFNRVRDLMYKWPIGRLGPTNDTNEYGFVDAAQYGMEVATSNAGTTWYQDWGTIYLETTGSNNNSGGNTLNGSSGADPATSNMPKSYWANLLPAIAYAVEHGASGASTAYARLTGATNWSTNISGFHNTPLWGILPRP